MYGLGRSQISLLGDAAYRSLRRALDYYASIGDLNTVVSIAELPDYSAARVLGIEQLVSPAIRLVPPGSLHAGRLLSRLGQIIGLRDAAYDEAIEALNQALDIARREEDEALEVKSLAAITSVYSNHMRYDESHASGLRLIELNKGVHDLRSEVSAHYFVVTALIDKGDLGAAKQYASEMLSQAERLGDRFWLEGAYWKNDMAMRLSGDWESARSFAQQALEIGSRPSNIISGLALLEHEVGNSIQGNAHLEYLAKSAREGSSGTRFLDLAASARVALAVPIVAKITGTDDDLESAADAADHILENPRSTALWIGQAHAGLAMMAIVRRDADTAANKYEIITARRHAFSFFSLSSDRLLGLLAQTMGEPDQAIIHFEDAVSFCLKGGYRP